MTTRGDLDREFGDDLVGLIPQLSSAALGMCRNVADARDLVQETMLKAWAARRRFRPGTNLIAWTTTILRNSWRTRLRKEKLEANSVFQADERPLVGTAQEWALACHEIRHAMDSLPPDQRDTLLLATVGYSYEEIASELRCATGTIRSRISRARETLRRTCEIDRLAA